MTGLIILAAGSSSRLGQPKQNLLYQQKTLLKRTVETATASSCRPIIVVLGSNADKIDIINLIDVDVIHNDNWNEGMASSIRIAIKQLENYQEIDQVMIMLCDQPFVTPKLLHKMLIKQVETGKPVVVCSYNNTIGVPVLFNKSLFPELMQLQGHDGAKAILKNHQDIALIPFDQGSIDIDTLADYENLIKSGN